MKKNFVLILFLLNICFGCFTQKLTEYITFSKHVDIEKYLSYNSRNFDPQGIILEKGKYHPLTISFYGIMACENYAKHKDSISYTRLKNQFNFFIDTTKIHLKNQNTEMGLPYNFNFSDLKAPWYSGMTQGAGISFMLRYYEITKDERAKTIAKQLCSFMLKEASKGGALGKTPENDWTIEEYPNSKNNSHVFNGFIIGLIGLYEYTLYFPEDTFAVRIHNECYEGLFNTLERLDTPTWTKYNRNNRDISNFYIRFQLNEFEHLYRMYNDKRFLHQMMIWGMMAYNKFDTQVKFHTYPNFQYSVNMVENESAIKTPNWKKDDEIVVRNDFKNSFLIHKSNNLTITSNDYFNQLELTTNEKLNINKLKILNLHPDDYQVHYSDSTIILKFENHLTKNITLLYNRKIKKGSNINQVKTGFKPEYHKPFFAFDFSQKQKVEKGKKYTIRVIGENLDDLTIFYRFANNKEQIENKKWVHYNIIENDLFDCPEDGTLQLMINYRLNDKPSFIKEIKFE